MSELSVFEFDGELVVDSRLIAQELGIEHESFMRTIRNYQNQIEKAFGVFRFEIGKPQGGSKGGRPIEFVYLNENQATFLMTVSRNTLQVVECKLNLVKAFARAKEVISQRVSVQKGTYWYERVMIAMSDKELPLQKGYFCAYLQMMEFFQQLEVHAKYVVPDTNSTTGKYIVPDISIGKRFNEWLRSDAEQDRQIRLQLLGSEQIVDFRPYRQNKDKITGKKVWMPPGNCNYEIIQYNHVYPLASHSINNIIPVNSYPNKYLEIFQYFLSNIWIPKDCNRYLIERDENGWKQAIQYINSLSPQARQALAQTLIGSVIPSLPPGTIV